MQKTIVQNLLTTYYSVGKGPTILLLHGWGDAHNTFYSLEQQFSDKYRLIAMDLPGFGASDAPPENWGLNDYANFVGEFCKKVINEELYCVIGHSNGGAIAVTAIGKGIVHSKNLVLLASSGVRPAKTMKKGLIKVVAKTGKTVLRVAPKSIRKKMKSKLYDRIGSDYLAVPHMGEIFKRVVAEDVRADAKNIHIPTLLVYGVLDRDVPIDAVAKPLQHEIKSSKLVEIEGAGHFVHHDAVQRVCDEIRKFIS